MKLVFTLIFLVNIGHLDQLRAEVAEGNVTIENESILREGLYPSPINLKADFFFVQSKYNILEKLNKFSPQIALCIENSVTKQLIKNSIIPNAPPASFS
jgi:hypothetical protein